MKRFGREIALLTLPVLIFGGLALWRSRGGSMARLQGAPSDIYSGKPRVEIGEIKPLQMTPWDVAQGFVWGVDATIWQGGQSPMAPGVKELNVSSSCHAHVFYRRGTRWLKAESPDKMSLIHQGSEKQKFGDFAWRSNIRLMVRVADVPRDAEEVRLRGDFVYQYDYHRGCRGVEGPGWNFYDSGQCDFTLHSKPFDIPIVKSKGAWPNPNVSRETPLALVDAKWFVDPYNGDKFVVQIRRKDGKVWTQETGVVQRLEVLDASQQPLELLDSRTGRIADINNFGSYSPEQFSPQRSKSDLFMMPVVTYSVAPSGGWSSVKFPITLRAEVSDGTCWPLKIDTEVERVQMKTEDFGAAK